MRSLGLGAPACLHAPPAISCVPPIVHALRMQRGGRQRGEQHQQHGWGREQQRHGRPAAAAAAAQRQQLVGWGRSWQRVTEVVQILHVFHRRHRGPYAGGHATLTVHAAEHGQGQAAGPRAGSAAAGGRLRGPPHTRAGVRPSKAGPACAWTDVAGKGLAAGERTCVRALLTCVHAARCVRALPSSSGTVRSRHGAPWALISET